MAKLKAPLLSLGASGAISKTLVFFGWKGLNVVREYVVPSNPQTSLQTVQRGYVTDAVAEIHATQAQAANPLTSEDQVAYSTLASTLGKVMTWFNMAVKLWIDVKVAAKVPVVYSWGYVTDTDLTAIDMSMVINEETGSTLAAGKFYIGTSKTNLIRSVTATVNAGSDVNIINEDLSAWMVAGIKYYWQFRPDSGDGCEGANSGIYSFVAS